MSLGKVWDPMIGAAELAVGRRKGIERFGASRESFLASLAPLIAFPLVGAAGVLMHDGAALALTTLLLTVIAQLGPAVLSHAVAVRWEREAAWLRYATAFNWCQWALPVLLFGALIVVQTVSGAAELSAGAVERLFMALGVYALFLHYTLVRAGLTLSWWRSALMVLLVNGGTAALILGPHWVARALAA